ncbi:hypothetical protein KGQ34_01610 [Patescibacteria group bacterium]|nr:hypothetical protein [Patescibacteria group bacterium]
MPQVYVAEPYRYGALGSFGNAQYMLIRQFQFPLHYTERDAYLSADSDRCFQWDYDHARWCFEKHTKTGENELKLWVQRATNEEVVNFLKDILKADSGVRWTGYRILGTVRRDNGYVVWSFQLFANVSGVKVYTGSNAPNVKKIKLESNNDIWIYYDSKIRP